MCSGVMWCGDVVCGGHVHHVVPEVICEVKVMVVIQVDQVLPEK